MRLLGFVLAVILIKYGIINLQVCISASVPSIRSHALSFEVANALSLVIHSAAVTFSCSYMTCDYALV